MGNPANQSFSRRALLPKWRPTSNLILNQLVRAIGRRCPWPLITPILLFWLPVLSLHNWMALLLVATFNRSHSIPFHSNSGHREWSRVKTESPIKVIKSDWGLVIPEMILNSDSSSNQPERQNNSALNKRTNSWYEDSHKTRHNNKTSSSAVSKSFTFRRTAITAQWRETCSNKKRKRHLLVRWPNPGPI